MKTAETRPSGQSQQKNYQEISAEIAKCAAENGRDSQSITLLAVSKTRTADEISAVYDAGARHFGENYLQDALPKLQWFNSQQASNPNRFDAITWHFIGALQSNKASEVASNFSWVHCVDREKIARRLARARPDHLPPLNICLQVNLHDEKQKAGVHPDALPELLALVNSLPRLIARGLMILPAANVEASQAFDDLAELFERFRPEDPKPVEQWDTLSMGMSGDYRAAIAAGSTIVRIGTALFGARAQ